MPVRLTTLCCGETLFALDCASCESFDIAYEGELSEARSGKGSRAPYQCKLMLALALRGCSRT